ncbi:hypothetical protein AB833_22635 [Chromatiales bacterium (ex Bugula neritina AB1)]|nr:hypothetical protein AB833_22635 [Chromatiales bacterium (ex Bugula neritina AB1)]
MNFPLNELHRLSLAKCPSVLVTIIAIDGSSPEQLGAQLVVTTQGTFGQWRNAVRQQIVIEDAQKVLNGNVHWRLSSYLLNPVVNVDNGELTVLYQYFDSDNYPDWIPAARTGLQNGFNVVLHTQLKNSGDPPAYHLFDSEMPSSSWCALEPDSQQTIASMLSGIRAPGFTGKFCRNTTTLIHQLTDYRPTVCIVGDSAVGKALTKQLLLLPFNVIWLADTADSYLTGYTELTRLPLNDESFTKIGNRSLVSIATGDHELDLHFCERALQHPSLLFIGCLGSQKKADIIRSELKERGIDEAKTSALKIPVGLSSIEGKHPSVIATSIIAQMLTIVS